MEQEFVPFSPVTEWSVHSIKNHDTKLTGMSEITLDL